MKLFRTIHLPEKKRSYYATAIAYAPIIHESYLPNGTNMIFVVTTSDCWLHLYYRINETINLWESYDTVKRMIGVWYLPKHKMWMCSSADDFLLYQFQLWKV